LKNSTLFILIILLATAAFGQQIEKLDSFYGVPIGSSIGDAETMMSQKSGVTRIGNSMYDSLTYLGIFDGVSDSVVTFLSTGGRICGGQVILFPPYENDYARLKKDLTSKYGKPVTEIINDEYVSGHSFPATPSDGIRKGCGWECANGDFITMMWLNPKNGAKASIQIGYFEKASLEQFQNELRAKLNGDL